MEFSTPINVQIRDIGPRQFKTSEQLLEWANNEHDFWNAVHDKIRASNPYGFDGWLTNILTPLRQVIRYASEYNPSSPEPSRQTAYNNLSNELDNFRYDNTMSSKSPAGQLVARLADTDPAAAWIALSFNTSAVRVSPQNIDIVKLLKALDVVRDKGLNARKALDAITKSHQELEAEWAAHYQATVAGIKHDQKKFRRRAGWWTGVERRLAEKYKKTVEDHEVKMAAMEKAFSTDMKLRAAEKMWSKKQRLNRDRARVAMWKFGSFALCGIAVIAMIIVYAPDKLNVPANFSVPHTLVFVLPALVYIWMLRFFGNEYRVNQRLADDAEERVAMVMTFKALEYEQKAADNERHLILNALFRPHTAPGDESVPVSWFEALMSKTR